MSDEKIVIRILRPSDYAKTVELWKTSKGVGLRGDDTPKRFRAYLKQNPGMSLAATAGGRLVGTVMGGHDGRRGSLVHLAVAEDFRGRGIGRALVAKSLAKLEKAGIPRSHVMVMASNQAGRVFWKSLGWSERKDLVLFSSPFVCTGKRIKRDGSC
jgi:ribosomal protein S18 acetylase RimI-like enzyme